MRKRGKQPPQQQSKQTVAAPTHLELHDADGDPPPPPAISYKPRVVLLASLGLAAYVLLLVYLDLHAVVKSSVWYNLGISVGALFITLRLIPVCAPYVLRKGIAGYDINKKGTPGGRVRIPESLGAVTGTVFCLALFLFLYFYIPPTSDWLVEYLAALACALLMLFLGFVDDVVDLPWRVKLALPSAAAMPLIMAYSGPTSILVPKPLRGLVGQDLLDLHRLYKLYMVAFTVFSANSINIHAGVNGLEVGQTVVIAVAILIHNVTQVLHQQGADDAAPTGDRLVKLEAHAFSIYFMQPLVGTSLGLLAYNWYPSSVFVGDSFTYFAGMALAVAGILGHFSETLLLFFVPQILNFLYSTPQLFKIIPCPRHRLPIFDPKTGLLTGTKDLNLVNLFLRWFGPCTEQQLCIRLLIFQVLCCALGFGFRYILTGWYK